MGKFTHCCREAGGRSVRRFGFRPWTQRIAMRCARNHSAFAAVTLGVLAFFTPSLMASQSAGWAVTVAVNATVDQGENTAATSVVMGGKVVDGDRLTTGAGGA